jgi:methyl-accepting chemotaxis protein
MEGFRMRILKLNLFSKIFLSFFALVMLIVITISTTTYYASSSLLENGVNNQLNMLVQEKGNMFQEIINNSKTTGFLLSTNTEVVNYVYEVNRGSKSSQAAAVSQYLGKTFHHGNGLYENIFIGSIDGTILLDGIGGTSIGTELNGMDFFEAAKKGTQTLSKVMSSPATGRPVIVVGTPVKLGEEVIGIAAVAIEFKVLTKPITHSKIGEAGFTFIINRQGLVLAHSDADFVMKQDLSREEGSLGELGKRMTKEAQGTGTYTDMGNEKIVSFSQIPNSDFVVASTVYTREVNAPVTNLLGKSVIIGVISLILALAAAIALAKNLTGPVKKLATAVQRVAKGDFTYQLNIKRNDELGQLTDDFQTMQSGIRDMIEHITTTSCQVANTSRHLSLSTQEATKSIQHVATAIEQIAIGSEEQSKNAAETLKITGQVIQAIDQIATGAQDQSKNVLATSALVADMAAKIHAMAEGMLTVKEFSEQNGQVAAESGKVVEMTVYGMISVKNATTDTAAKINELGQQSQKI